MFVDIANNKTIMRKTPSVPRNPYNSAHALINTKKIAPLYERGPASIDIYTTYFSSSIIFAAISRFFAITFTGV